MMVFMNTKFNHNVKIFGCASATFIHKTYKIWMFENEV